VSGGAGFILMFAMIARVVGEPQTLVGSALAFTAGVAWAISWTPR